MPKKTINKRNIWKAIIGAFMVLIVLDLTPFGGNTIVYAKYIQCGENDIVQNDSVYSGDVPHYKKTPRFTLLRGIPKYFCTPEEAERNGYSAERTTYSFPHLPKSEWQNSIQKARSIMSR